MATTMDLRAATTAARARVERRKGERSTLQNRKGELESALATAREQSETFSHAAALLREAADYARQRTLERVQGLTSSGLQSVFGAGYGFRLESGEVGGRPVVTCQVVSPYGDDDAITTEGIDARGGGVVDIQAISLRIAMLQTAMPAIDGSLLLDEPAKHVSEENVPAAGRFLRESCTRFGRQVIMVTHNPSLAALADRVVQVSMRDGVSVVA